MGIEKVKAFAFFDLYNLEFSQVYMTCFLQHYVTVIISIPGKKKVPSFFRPGDLEAIYPFHLVTTTIIFIIRS